MPASNADAAPAARTPAAPADRNRFARLTPACLSGSEKSSIVTLALGVLRSRCRPRRAFATPEDIERFLQVKLSGRRNEVFGILFLDLCAVLSNVKLGRHGGFAAAKPQVQLHISEVTAVAST